MRILKVEPGKAPYEKEIENNLDTIQQEVGGGLFQVLYMGDGSFRDICDFEPTCENRSFKCVDSNRGSNRKSVGRGCVPSNRFEGWCANRRNVCDESGSENHF